MSTNLARNRPTSISTVFGPNVPGHAVDGVRTGSWYNRLAATDYTKPPPHWFALDLLYVFLIKNIALWPRLDCCQLRISNVTVVMSLNASMMTNPVLVNNKALCNVTYLAPMQPYVNASCMNCQKGFRYVALITYAEELDLAEIEVYGHPANCPFHFTYAYSWNKCLLVTGDRFSWDEARSRCYGEGADMLMFNKLSEISVTNPYFAGKINGSSLIWTSGTRIGSSGSFGWMGVDGMQQPLAFSNWQADEPNPIGNCLAINSTSLLFLAIPCNQSLAVVCQIYLKN